MIIYYNKTHNLWLRIRSNPLGSNPLVEWPIMYYKLKRLMSVMESMQFIDFWIRSDRL